MKINNVGLSLGKKSVNPFKTSRNSTTNPFQNVSFEGRTLDLEFADVFEAVIASIYLNNGLSKAKEFIYDIIIPKIEENNVYLSDYKSYLQELVQTNQKSVEYIVVNEYGPSHDKTFEVEARVDGMLYGSGIGKSKKEAEQNAARDAIKKSSGGTK